MTLATTTTAAITRAVSQVPLPPSGEKPSQLSMNIIFVLFARTSRAIPSL